MEALPKGDTPWKGSHLGLARSPHQGSHGRPVSQDLSHRFRQGCGQGHKVDQQQRRTTRVLGEMFGKSQVWPQIFLFFDTPWTKVDWREICSLGGGRTTPLFVVRSFYPNLSQPLLIKDQTCFCP